MLSVTNTSESTEEGRTSDQGKEAINSSTRRVPGTIASFLHVLLNAAFFFCVLECPHCLQMCVFWNKCHVKILESVLGGLGFGGVSGRGGHRTGRQQGLVGLGDVSNICPQCVTESEGHS